MHFKTYDGAIDQAGVQAFKSRFPMSPATDTVVGRTILEGRVVHVLNVDSDSNLHPSVAALRSGGSILGVPLIRDGQPIGAITLNGKTDGGFTDSQIALLQTFAEQAVIAIGTVATYRQLQERTAALAARNSEFGERIEQQSATIDVLKVMSASPGDPQPVFEQIARQARELCNGRAASLFQVIGGLVHCAAVDAIDINPMPPAFAAYMASFPRALARDMIPCRAILDQRIIHIRDAEADLELSPLTRGMVRGRYRSQVVIPLMRDGQAIGSISLTAAEPGGFSDSRIALLQTFAEQAVIAISSAETYRELQTRTAALALRNSEFGERIEQQSATIDVLKVMSASPSDPQPAFDMIARRAQELCNGAGVRMVEFDGNLVYLRAVYGAEPAARAAYQAAFPLAPTRGSVLCRAILDKQITYIRNMDTEPGLFAIGKNMGMKSVLAVPLLRDERAIGAISIGSLEYDSFSDSQVALLQTFAEQAVIAISSAETYRQLQERTAALALRNSEFGERIEQQSATIDVLKVMSASPDDPQPVFALIAERSRAFCEAEVCGVGTLDDGILNVRAHRGLLGPVVI